MDNFNYNAAGQIDEFVMPSIDLTGIANPKLIFHVAYSAYDATHFERLHIEYSTDCGVTFNPTTYDKEHLVLATTPDYHTSGWAPTSASEWRIETIDISAYSSSQTIFKFIQTAGFGNGLFIEDVEVKDQLILPVELTHFKAARKGFNNQLTWQTASEENNKGFHIEKSVDATNWQVIGFVSGKGTTTGFSNYEFQDKQPWSGLNYYRLKQIDFDGKQEYSEIRSVQNDQSNSRLSIYPNPSSSLIYINSSYDDYGIEVFNSIGQRIKVAENIREMDVSYFPSGTYCFKIYNRQQHAYEILNVEIVR